MSAIFITGTDTEVGKTYISGLLLDFLTRQGINTGYQKWVSTGGVNRVQDLRSCLNCAGLAQDESLLDLQVPFRFSFPASPHLAAEKDGRIVDPEQIISAFQAMQEKYEVLLVEGVGGLLVPLTRELFLADFLARLQIPALLVARSGLGTLNHTFMSLETLRERDIPVVGVVFSDGEDGGDEFLINDNMQTVAAMSHVPVLGRLPRCRDIDQAKEAFVPIGQAFLEAFDAPSY